MEASVTQAELDAGRGYEALFVPALFKPWVKHLLAGANVEPGSSVLDVACGTGVAAREALEIAGNTGRVVGLDEAPGMIAVAKEVAPEIDWVLGNAEALGFDDATFDCVLSQFGLMFFQNPDGAAREMHRVLKPGGRLAVAVWDSIGNNPAYHELALVLDVHVSTEAGDALRLPFSMGDADEVVSVLEEGGFTEIKPEARTENARFPSARTVVEAELRGWLPLFGINLNEEEIANILAKSERSLSGYSTPSGEAIFPTSALVVTAKKH